MKILVEASTLNNKHKSGVYFFNVGLLEQLQEQVRDLQMSFLYVGGAKPSLPTGLRGEVIWLKHMPTKIWQLLMYLGIAPRIEFLKKINKYDIFFCPGFITPPTSAARKTITLIHDTAFLDVGEYFPARFRKYMIKMVGRSVRVADQIIVNSRSTKESLVRHFAVSDKKISIINPAVDEDFFRSRSNLAVKRTLKKYHIKKKYLLYLGNIEPRKNVLGIIRAYNMLGQNIRDEYSLVLAGGKGWLDHEIRSEIEASARGEVISIGYVDSDDKPALYSGAEIFLYPSFFEGWGMPILEAMACGTPVITANNSSLTEAGGDAAAYVRAGDDPGLSKRIEALLKDPQKRQKMSEAGLLQAKKYTWKESGQKLVRVFGAKSG